MFEKNEALEKDLVKLAEDLSGRLWAVHRNDLTGRKLIMPVKRDATTRVSEQESKILLCGLLESSQWHYSIETPTLKTYVQKGKTPQSARCDVSLYESRDANRRMVNIELKAHNCTEENIRKDLEKLLREGIPGLWFHTLAAADMTTINSLFKKFRDAFLKEKKHLGESSQFIVFAFCILDPANTIIGILRINGTAGDVISRIDRTFIASSISPRVADPWQHFALEGQGNVATSQEGISLNGNSAPRGSRESELVFCPEIDPATFLHLSIRGNSYRLRRFNRGDHCSFMAPGATTLEELRAEYEYKYSMATTSSDRMHNLDNGPSYWEQRIQELNRLHGLS